MYKHFANIPNTTKVQMRTVWFYPFSQGRPGTTYSSYPRELTLCTEYKHRRFLEIYLRLVEKHLCHINDSLETDFKNSRFMIYSISNNLNAETRTRMQNVQGMLDEIAKLKEKFNLGSEEVNARALN
jgi:hypothetical protein